MRDILQMVCKYACANIILLDFGKWLLDVVFRCWFPKQTCPLLLVWDASIYYAFFPGFFLTKCHMTWASPHLCGHGQQHLDHALLVLE